MSKINRNSLKRLIALQTLSKARLDMVIARDNAELSGLQQQDVALFAMQERFYEQDELAVDPAVVLGRLGRNAGIEAGLKQRLADQCQSHLQISRRVEVLNQRLSSHDQLIDCRQNAVVIEEFVAGQLRKRN